MSEINRFSSRRQRLDHAFLSVKLQGAESYKRIAGYFRSSIFELVGEEIAAIPKVQIVCNSELDAADVAVSKHVRETALKERWNEAPVRGRGAAAPGSLSPAARAADQRPGRDPRRAEGPRLHPRQGRRHRSGRRLEDLLPRLDQRDQERLRPELRDPVGGPLARGCRLGRGGVRGALEGRLPAARRHRRGNQARRRPRGDPLRGGEDRGTARRGAGREPDLPRRRTAPALAALVRDDVPAAPGDLRQGAPAAGRRGGRRQDAVAGGQRHDLGPAGRRPGAHPLPLDADAAVAGGAHGQARHPERGLVVHEEGVDRSRRATSSRPAGRRTSRAARFASPSSPPA